MGRASPGPGLWRGDGGYTWRTRAWPAVGEERATQQDPDVIGGVPLGGSSELPGAGGRIPGELHSSRSCGHSPKLLRVHFQGRGKRGQTWTLPAHPVLHCCCPLTEVWVPLKVSEGHRPATFTCTLSRGPAMPPARDEGCLPPPYPGQRVLQHHPFLSARAPGLATARPFDRNLSLFIQLMSFL